MNQPSGIQLIKAHFPELSDLQLGQLEQYVQLLIQQNQVVNLISRKNEARVWEEHILHSLGLVKVVAFDKGDTVLDVGTGGGLPGIPLAICFPEADFMLVDSIRKKITAVNEMIAELGLTNVRAEHGRAEELNQKFDYVVSRAVTALPKMAIWLRGMIKKKAAQKGAFPNGLIYIKGGDFLDELKEIKRPYQIWELSEWFEDPFFETKKVVWIGLT